MNGPASRSAPPPPFRENIFIPAAAATAAARAPVPAPSGTNQSAAALRRSSSPPGSPSPLAHGSRERKAEAGRQTQALRDTREPVWKSGGDQKGERDGVRRRGSGPCSRSAPANFYLLPSAGRRAEGTGRWS